MTRQEAFATLRTILAALYPHEASARLVVADAGLNERRIAFSGTAVNTWQSILREAENANKMEDIFRVVLGEYDTNFELRSACEAYRRSTKGTAPQPGSARDSAVMKILFLAANPTDTTRLRLDEESRAIDQALRQAEYRDRFDIRQHWAVRVADLQGLLMRHQPHIVHFSGHGSNASGITSSNTGRHLKLVNSSGESSGTNSIILEDDNGRSHPVSPRALSTVFSLLKDNIRCVVLNACYSEQQAQAIAEHIDCVVGMSESIGDRAAISFATAFYQALGYGRDVKTAFALGRAQIDLENVPEVQTPQLLATKADPAQIVLVSP
jgi:hypothetical protein